MYSVNSQENLNIMPNSQYPQIEVNMVAKIYIVKQI